MTSQLVITTEKESGVVGKKNILLDKEMDGEPAVVRAKILRSLRNIYQDDELVIGIDPGKRIGIAVFYLQEEIDSQVVNSIREGIDLISGLVRGTKSKKKIVRIGYGDPTMARQIAEKLHTRFLDKVRIELVDEYGTSRLGLKGRGMRDKLSARVIASRKGTPITPLLSIQK